MSSRCPAWVSIHDLMPHTLEQVQQIIELLLEKGIGKVDLLVVPGLAWTSTQIHQLQVWSQQGHRIVAHGWQHKAPHIRGLRHRLHAALLSKDVAEHLSCSTAEEIELMHKSRAWFPLHDLPTPTHYVPPAWALGPITPKQLASIGFNSVEVLQGCYFGMDMRLYRLPLVGFEADTRWRAKLLSPWNQAQESLAKTSGRALRISLHPYDLQLHLSNAIPDLLARIQPLPAERCLPQLNKAQESPDPIKTEANLGH